jgi:hypothetical protein
MCKRTVGVPQELGRSRRLLGNIPGRSHRVNNSRPRRRTRPPGSEPNEWNRGTTKRRQRSAAGRATGSRSALILPVKQGNSPRRTLWRKAKRRPADSIEGNMLNTSRFSCMSPQLDRIASGTIADGEPVGRRTVCSSASTYGSVGALAGNRQGHPARSVFRTRIRSYSPLLLT